MVTTFTSLVLKTLIYADIFDYPLTVEEIQKWLIGKSASTNQIKDILGKLTQTHFRSPQFYFLSTRKRITEIRESRFIYAREKWRLVQRIGSILRSIPSVLCVGVTGGLAMDNVDDTDDIDLFFVVKSGYLWVSRLWIIFFIELFSRRRRPNEKEVKNRFCLNMFITDTELSVPVIDRDLYSAHEVLQMQPVWDREGTYDRFLKANSWVRTYLPNAWRDKNRELRIENRDKKQINTFSLFTIHYSRFFLRFLEPLARLIQLWYMKKHKTTEVVTDSRLQFHPHDARIWIRSEYAKRLARFNIPLDKEFLGSIK